MELMLPNKVTKSVDIAPQEMNETQEIEVFK
jgi:hypothetical protein